MEETRRRNIWSGVRWLNHYSSVQSILVVGDRDFSFSLALATAFSSGENIVATSLDSYVRPSRPHAPFHFIPPQNPPTPRPPLRPPPSRHGRPPPNSGDPDVVPATKAKKKKAPKGTKKPRSELASEEIAKLDAKLAKRRNRRAEAEKKDTATAYAIERAALEAVRQKADAQEKEAIVSKVHTLLMMGLCRPTSFAATLVGSASTCSSVVRSP
ncbi:Subtilisin-like protease [Hordeum vulgare]|nr:Subtilisin-like protease [Hordeum vulgare]